MVEVSNACSFDSIKMGFIEELCKGFTVEMRLL